ncbi:uncharacterized protein LOC126737078 isoform X2 [Anthonomus grandis grandis]|uniref:uncharacterized protein LOC126737078 isoform X2 n=1 Tax=Anthonomus grandis grandis TaxID=2921223 RepID=UPI0021661D54|nr:uncharacterized protein LOC126737078 isoform X2 [Anthonomus grandis grandis]
MNLNEPFLNAGGFKVPLIGPPVRNGRRSRSRPSSSRTSELPWGKSHESLILNSSSNKKSNSSRSSGDHEEEKIIVAITEGRGEARCEVGIAAVNVSRPVLVLCQTSDSQSYINTLTKLNFFNPHMIVYPATFEAGSNSRLITEIRKFFPNKKLIPIPRKAFNKANALDKLYKICITSSFPLLIMIKNRYYSLAAASGLLNYLQDSMFIYYASQTIKLEYQASEGYAIIDVATADRLELVCSNQPAEANKYSSLFGIMNRCLTRVGSRNLRSIILQPLYFNDKIDERLDCVQELIKNPEILISVQGVLPKLSSVDQLLSLSTLVPDQPQRCTNKQLNYLLLLKSVVDALYPLNEALKRANQPFFENLREILGHSDFETIKNVIREVIHEEAFQAKGQQGDQQRIWAIKPGINGLLDLVRKTYSERIEDMREYTKRLSQKYDLPLTLANNYKKGYHICLTLNQNQRNHMKKSDLPKEFIQIFRLSNSFTMKTVELVNLSTRIDDILADLFTLSNLMIHHIIVKIKQYAPLFYKLVEGISYLDVLQSLAEASYSNGWIRPTFGDYTEVTFGRHPLLDFLCQKKPISNPVVSCEHYNLHIITGPNGAGKSIFIRQVMLLQIMAQTGCFVPAQSAIFRSADKMFARISNDDDMESNASSFVLEMTEINYILTTMTDRSLIIIDELCRSTSLEEGTAMAMAICEELALSKAYTFVTTHFTLLTKLYDLFFNLKVWQLETIPSGDPSNPKTMKLDFKFSLVPGVTTLKGYGIYMVRGIWPQDVMRHVDEIQQSYSETTKDPTFPTVDKRARLKYNLQCKFKKLNNQRKITLSNINEYMQQYQKDMEQIDEECRKFSEEFSQRIMEQIQQESEANKQTRPLDHSVFDTQDQYLNYNHITSGELSKIFIDDLNQCPNVIGFDQTDQEEGIQYNQETMIPMPPASTEAKMFEMYAPDQNLDPSNSEVSQLTIEPDIHMRLDTSYGSCGLNFTQMALGLDAEQRARQGAQESPMPQCFDATYGQCNLNFTQMAMGLDVGQQIAEEPTAPGCFDTSYEGQCGLNFTQMALGLDNRQERRELTELSPRPGYFETTYGGQCGPNFTQMAMGLDAEPGGRQVAMDPSMPSGFNENYQQGRIPVNSYKTYEHYGNLERSIENISPIAKCYNPAEIAPKTAPKASPFIRHFAPPLLRDIRKTSTPLMKKLQCKNSSSYINLTSPNGENFTKITTPKITFTLPENVPEDLDINSLAEDLESLADDIQRDDEIDAGNEEPCRNAYENFEPIANNNNKHIFPRVRILVGPNQPSSEEDNRAHSSEFGQGIIVRPIVKGLYPTEEPTKMKINEDVPAETVEEKNNKNENKIEEKSLQKGTEVEQLIEAFNSLSNPTKIGRDKMKPLEEIANADNQINENLSQDEGKNMEKQSTDVEEMIKAFNRASEGTEQNTNERKEFQAEPDLKNIETSIATNIDKDPEYIKNMINAFNKASEGNDLTEIPILQENDKKEINCKQIKEIVIDTQAEVYFTADSNSDFSYSPLVPRTQTENTSLELKNLPEPDVVNTDVNKSNPNDMDWDTATIQLNASPSISKLEGSLTQQYQTDVPLVENHLKVEVVMEHNSNPEENNVNIVSDISHKQTLANSGVEVVEIKENQNISPDIFEDDAYKDKSTNALIEPSKKIEVHNVIVIRGPTEITNDVSFDTCNTTCLLESFNEKIIKDGETFTKKVENINENNQKESLSKESKKGNSTADNKLDTISKVESLTEANPIIVNRTTSLEMRPLLNRKTAEKRQIDNRSPEETTSNNKTTKKLRPSSGISAKESSDSSKSADVKDKTEFTSISEASRLRNLEGETTNTSSSKPENVESNIETCEEGLSDLSRKRNLDGEGTNSTSSRQERITSSTSKERFSNSDKPKRQKKKVFRKFKAPIKKSSEHLMQKKTIIVNSSSDEMLSAAEDTKAVSTGPFNSGLKPGHSQWTTDPSKLSQKAIRSEFLEQDKRFFETSGSSLELAKLWEERLKRPPRPTPKQIQQTTCVATIRKTHEGVEVIPSETQKPRNTKAKSNSWLFQPHPKMNMNIFSDQNADTFDEFIKSKNNDYKMFNFKLEYGQTSPVNSQEKMFDFKQVKTATSEYTENSQSWTFVRRSQDNNGTMNFQFKPDFITFDNSSSQNSRDHRNDISSLLGNYRKV